MSSPQISVSHALLAGIITGGILGIWEVYLLENQLSMTALHILSLLGLFGCILGMALAFCIPPISVWSPPSLQWIGWGLNAPQRLRYTSIGLTFQVVTLPFSGVLFSGAWIAHRFNRPLLAGAFVALTGFMALGGVALIWARIYQILFKILNQVSQSGNRFTALPLLVWVAPCLVGVGGMIKYSQLPLGAYQLGGYWEFVYGLGIAGGLMLILRKRSISLLIPIIFMLGISGLSYWSLNQWPSEHPSNQLLTQHAQLASLIITPLRRLADDDGDGVADAFGGGDCDDQNPEIHPQAKDIPDNGIDENCLGGDLVTPPPPPPPPKPKASLVEPKPWNVLLILVDTLRASHIQHYGYTRPTMPNLTQFAQTATTFDRAFAHAPRTPFSIPSLLIGRYPSRLKWIKRFTSYGRLTDENQTLFERFKEAGWQTEAVSAHWYFGKKKNVNLNQGLDQWDNRGELSISKSNTQSAAQSITRRLIDRLTFFSENQKKFFMFAHYFAPHGRYMDHRVKCKQSKKWCHVEPRCAEHPTRCIFGDSKAKSVKKLINKYDSELAYTDLHLGDLFKSLQDLKLDQNTIVVITSDHGESFKDRKPAFIFHGRSVYNEEVHVPLIVKTPQSLVQRRDEIIGLVDIAPTLGSLTGVKMPRTELDGQSFASLLNTKDTHEDDQPLFSSRPLFIEQLPYPNYEVHMTAVVDPTGKKIIRNLTDQTWASFDLSTDWREQKNQNNNAQFQKEIQPLKNQLIQFLELTP